MVNNVVDFHPSKEEIYVQNQHSQRLGSSSQRVQMP